MSFREIGLVLKEQRVVKWAIGSGPLDQGNKMWHFYNFLDLCETPFGHN